MSTMEIGVNRERLGMPADRIEVAREPQQRTGPDGSIRGGGEASICRDGARSITVLELEHVDAAKRFGGYLPQRGEHRQERDSAGRHDLDTRRRKRHGDRAVRPIIPALGQPLLRRADRALELGHDEIHPRLQPVADLLLFEPPILIEQPVRPARGTRPGVRP